MTRLNVFTSSRSRRIRVLWIVAAVAIAGALFWAATNDAVYETTSPSWFTFHVALRKAYSVVAFALVGFTADKALGPSARPVLRSVLLVAAYSGAIEIAQKYDGSTEGLWWNSFDVLCGAVGGWLGVVIEPLVRARRV